MNSSERILVVILAGALAVFLILAIFAAIKTIQILNKIKRLTDKAETIGEAIRRAATPLAVGKILRSTIFKAKRRRKNRREYYDE